MNKINKEIIREKIDESIGYSHIPFREKRIEYEYILKIGDQSLLLFYDNDSYLANPSFKKLDEEDIIKNYKTSKDKESWNARIQLCFRSIKLYDDHFEVSLYTNPDKWVPVSYHGITKIGIF